MSTTVANPSEIAVPRSGPVRTGLWLPAMTLWQRELVRFYRQRSRVVGVIGSPIIFWLVIGSGFGSTFSATGATGGQGFLEYFFPGTLVLILLFTAIFTMMSVIEDRQEGFLLSVLAAPCPRVSIVLGKVFGGATLAAVQGLIFALLAPTIGIHLTLLRFFAIAGVVALISFALTAVGFIVAWNLDSTHAFHAIVNLFLIPAWLLSGALFPVTAASRWIKWGMMANPLTYGTEALRSVLYPGSHGVFGLTASLTTIIAFDLVMLAVALWMVSREAGRKAA